MIVNLDAHKRGCPANVGRDCTCGLFEERQKSNWYEKQVAPQLHTSQPQLFKHALSASDIVYTPDWVAADMVKHFAPSGRVLEPCIGEGAIFKHLPAGALWCEIAKGRDFFEWQESVDWIITNPPYSMFDEVAAFLKVNKSPKWIVYQRQVING